MEPGSAIGLAARGANAVHATGLYAAKTLVPTGLAVFHPHPALVEPVRGAWTAGALAALAFVVLASAAAVGLRRRAPYALVGWLAYLGMLVQVSGLVQVGLHSWAERYTYLPSLGLLVALVWSADALARTPFARRVLAGLALAACAGLALATVRQLAHWRDDTALFTRALAVEERNPVAHVNLGRVLEDQGELARAEAHYARALELAPSLVEVRVNLARVLAARGSGDAARAELERALADRPDFALAHAQLGWRLAEVGRDGEALAHLRRALALEPPDVALVVNSLAWVLATSRTHAAPEEALALAEELCRASGDRQAGFLETRAAALARLGRHAEAVEWQARAIERVPAAQQAPLRARLALYRAGKPYLKAP
jgi:tetratricopeptide (TPR) repeat protein